MQVGVDIGSYTFDASAKTITFSGVGLTSIEQIKPIINGTRNIDIFNPLTAGKFGTLVGQVLTLDFNTSTHADTDKLYICINKPLAANEAHGTVSVTTASQLIVAPNVARKEVILFNDTNKRVSVCPFTPAVFNQGIILESKVPFILDSTSRALYVIGDTGVTGNLIWQEINE